MNILLLHPPQAKPAEPPAGIPLLAASLRAHGCGCTVCDLNIEGLHYLLATGSPAADTWSRRAHKNRRRHLQNLRSAATYTSPDRYTRAVADLNRCIENSGRIKGVSLSLANYQDQRLSPLKSEDLLLSAEQYRDNIFFPFFSERLSGLIEKEAPDYIGISLNYLSQALCTFAIIGFLKNRYPRIRLILGGGLVTTWLQSAGWSNPFTGLVDHMIAGPGEMPLVELLTRNTASRRCCPDYTDLLDNLYLAPGMILPYAASTGCFWRKCAFCPETSEGNPYCPVTTDTAISEITTLIGRTRPALLHLLDNAVSPAMLTALTHTHLQVPWYGFVRFSEHLADPLFCGQLRDSGCVMLKIGLESGSQSILDQMNKGVELRLVTKALAALHQAGIMTYVYLLFGTPGESLAEARQTMQFVREHHRQITFLNLAVFNLPAGSTQVNELEISGFYEGDLSIYTDFSHPRGWGRKEIRRFLDSEFRRDPVIQRILHNDPLHFTSNHAPFFTSALFQAGKIST